MNVNIPHKIQYSKDIDKRYQLYSYSEDRSVRSLFLPPIRQTMVPIRSGPLKNRFSEVRRIFFFSFFIFPRVKIDKYSIFGS